MFVVVRDGDDAPGPNDWEAQFHTDQTVRVDMARHDLAFSVADGIDAPRRRPSCGSATAIGTCSGATIDLVGFERSRPPSAQGSDDPAG